jgi:thymidylate synthase ThyX
MNNVQILADSLNTATGDRLTTFLLPRFPKCLLAELNTHRMLSRNAASSRAIPIEKMIERVNDDPYIPQWTINQKGMQGKVAGKKLFIEEANLKWFRALNNAADEAMRVSRMGIHKQNANRLLEPFMRVPVIVSGTEWNNFFKLRCDESTHPDFRSVAREMQQAYKESTPAQIKPGGWHIPFGDRIEPGTSFADKLRIATARHARISYTSHDGNHSVAKDLELHSNLLSDGHLSPFEHCAMASGEVLTINDWRIEGNYFKPGNTKVDCYSTNSVNTRNYRGFYSYRAHLEDGVSVE